MDKIYFAKVNPKAIIPSKERENAGYDFYACFDEDFIVIESHETKAVPTGIAWASDPKYYLQIEERSSTGIKGIKKSAGVIDSGYRGEIMIAITNSTKQTLIISKIDAEKLSTYPQFHEENLLVYPYTKAIAQGVVHEVIDLDVEEIPYTELAQIKSNRGTGAFGSSNK